MTNHSEAKFRLNPEYDWVVLGDHPGALLSACLAARVGFSVLVLPLGRRLKPTFSQEGQIIDFESNFYSGLGKVGTEPGLFRSCLEKLGVIDDFDSYVEPPEMPQVLTPGFRVSLGMETKDFDQELRRELGEELASKLGFSAALLACEKPTQDYWQHFPDLLTFQDGSKKKKDSPLGLNSVRRKLKRSLSHQPAGGWLSNSRYSTDLNEWGVSDEFQQLCRGFWVAATGSDQENPQLWELLQNMAVSKTAASFSGGGTALREYLLQLAKRLGAHVPREMSCRRIFVENGRLVGLQIAEFGNLISVRGGVLGTSLDEARSVINLSGGSLFRGLRYPPKPQGWRFTLALTVTKHSIPPGLLRRNIWVEGQAPPIELEVGNPSDYGQDRKDCRLLFLRTQMPFTPESLDPEFQMKVAARMYEQVREVIPFLDRHVLQVYPNFYAALHTECGIPKVSKKISEKEFLEVYGFESLMAIPENIRMMSGHGVGSRSGVEGLFTVSGESYPSLGSLGSVVASLESIAWLSHRSGLSGPIVS